jgi:uncharacterized protein YbjT (DUF2867 family)
MNIISGASGQVGSAVAADLVKKRLPVKGLVRDGKKTAKLKEIGAVVAVGDVHDQEFLRESFQDGETLFVLTPEDGEIEDILGDTKIILDNYRKAIIDSPIKKVVGLSSMGAQYKNDSGNLKMSYMLEHEFSDLDVKQIFIRPAYYYSNWLPYLKQAEEEGVLRTFYPVNLSIPMVSPYDVAKLLAEVIAHDRNEHKIYEIEGPVWLSSNDVAAVFSDILGKKIMASQIPKYDWSETLAALKFSKDGIKNFIEMTETVVSGKSKPEGNGTVSVKGKVTLKQFLEEAMAKNE